MTGSSRRSIVDLVGPSAEQRPAVLHRGGDVVVVAGAGTGKTRTLVARYLSLLEDGASPRSIIAATFTLKAAREMRNRLREVVQSYLRSPDLDEDVRRRWRDVLIEMDGARVGTIHGLCAEVLRAHPVEAGLDPRFEVLDETQAVLLKADAVERAVAVASEDPTQVCLFDVLDERRLREALALLVGRHIDVDQVLERLPSDGEADLAGFVRQARCEALAKLAGERTWHAAAACLAERAAATDADRLDVLRRAVLAACEGLERELGGGSADGLLLAGDALDAACRSISLGVGSARNWPGGADDTRAVGDALKAIRQLWRDRRACSAAPNGSDAALAAVLPALRAAYRHAVSLYDADKARRNALDFDDLERRTLQLLEAHAEVRARWQSEVQAVLVDEMQDTNERQSHILRHLAGECGHLFVVGDAKQSIYRFRGADVRVFRRHAQAVQAGGGLVAPLQSSYRAHAAMLVALNRLLEPVLGSEPDPNAPYREPFAPLLPPLDAREPRPAPLGIGPPYVEVHLAAGSKEQGGLERAAEALARRLRAMVEGPAPVAVAGAEGLRRLDYGDVAVLCRASASFGAYEDAFEREGIAFLTVSGRGFYDRPEVRDLVNALVALCEPRNDIALVGLLRSPVFAVSDVGIYRLCARRRDAQESLWSTLVTCGPALDGEDGRACRRAIEDVGALRARVGRVTVAELLDDLVRRTGYLAALQRAGAARAALNVSKLVADARGIGALGVGEFVEHVAAVRDVGAREGEARALAEGSVQVMTVHAAKGLEFPVVVLGDATRQGGGGRGAVTLDARVGPLLDVRSAPDAEAPAAYRVAGWRSAEEEDAEDRRLLYVAATRARDLLLVSGSCAVRKEGGLGPGGWLQLLAEPLGLTGVSACADDEGDREIDLCLDPTLATGTLYEPRWSTTAGPAGTTGGSPARRAVETSAAPTGGGSSGAATTPRPGEAATISVGGAPAALAANAPSSPSAGGERPTWPLLDPVPRPRPHGLPTGIAGRPWRIVPVSVRHTAPAWVVGAVVHEAVAAWRLEGPDLLAWAASRAREHGLVDETEASDAARRATRLLGLLARHPLAAEIARADPRRHEVPIVWAGDHGRVEIRRADIVFRSDAWSVVELKTDHVSRARAEALLRRPGDGYLAQVREYADALAATLGARPRALVCMLDVDGQVAVYGEDGGWLDVDG